MMSFALQKILITQVHGLTIFLLQFSVHSLATLLPTPIQSNEIQ